MADAADAAATTLETTTTLATTTTLETTTTAITTTLAITTTATTITPVTNLGINPTTTNLPTSTPLNSVSTTAAPATQPKTVVRNSKMKITSTGYRHKARDHQINKLNRILLTTTVQTSQHEPSGLPSITTLGYTTPAALTT